MRAHPARMWKLPKLPMVLILGLVMQGTTCGGAPDQGRDEAETVTELLENAMRLYVLRPVPMNMHLSPMAPDPAAQAAFRDLGTNALPHLIRMIKDGSGSSADLAVRGFELLGAIAKPAIPALEKTARVTPPDKANERAVRALRWIGSDALPTLIRLSTNSVSRLDAVVAIIELGSEGVAVQPAVAEILNEGDMAAEIAVTGLHNWPATNAFPILTNVLQHPKPRMRKAAAEEILWIGDQRRLAIPGLVRCLYDSDAEVRQAAVATLSRVAPQLFATNPPSVRLGQ